MCSLCRMSELLTRSQAVIKKSEEFISRNVQLIAEKERLFGSCYGKTLINFTFLGKVDVKE